ncbi:nascent polypeptide-associated complex subunit alpha, muscle-specific form-like [Heliangelus exortis]|uniref:nascent polypeptide-associated complex subunit alpha, muscle-specific form-like n=1 Tax=Heliangelus exortis TaxID=472823 RepID=UPI003A92D2D5
MKKLDSNAEQPALHPGSPRSSRGAALPRVSPASAPLRGCSSARRSRYRYPVRRWHKPARRGRHRGAQLGRGNRPRRSGCQAGYGGAERPLPFHSASPIPETQGRGPGLVGSAEQQEAGLGAGRAVSEPSPASLLGGTVRCSPRAPPFPRRYSPHAAPRAPATGPQQHPRQHRRPLPAGQGPTHRRGTRRRRFPRGQPEGPRCLFPFTRLPVGRWGAHPPSAGPPGTGTGPAAPGAAGRLGGPALTAAARPGGRCYVTRAAAGRRPALRAAAVKRNPCRAAAAGADTPAGSPSPSLSGHRDQAVPAGGRTVLVRRQAGGHRHQKSAAYAWVIMEKPETKGAAGMVCGQPQRQFCCPAREARKLSASPSTASESYIHTKATAVSHEEGRKNERTTYLYVNNDTT